MRINNPLTVIAVFSMLTEASAAVSLPYIDSEHQKIYVWFLIAFPSILTTLFFLTLNFNNKTLYTPADLSKAENTHAATTCLSRLDTEHASLFKNTSAPAHLFKPPPFQPDTKYTLYTPQNLIFLPQGQSTYDPEPPSFSEQYKGPVTGVTESHILIEGMGLKKLHLIDLSHQYLQAYPNSTSEDILHTYHKATRKFKNNNPKNDVLLLLTNQHSNIPSDVLRLAINNFKHRSAIAHVTIISYNTDAHRLAILNPP